MVEAHFNKVILSVAKKVSYKSSNVVPHSHEEVFLQLWRMVWIGVFFKASVSCAASSEIDWQVILVFEHLIAPDCGSKEIKNLVNTKGSLSTSLCLQNNVFLFLAKWHEHFEKYFSHDHFCEGKAYGC